MTEEQQPFIPEAPAVPAAPEAPKAVEKATFKAGGIVSAIIPQTLDEAFRYAQMVFVSGMFPDWIRKNRDAQMQATCVTAIIVKGLEVGLPPMSALANIMEVNNRFTIWGDAAKALVLNSGQCEVFREWSEGEYGNDDYRWVCEIKMAGKDTVRSEFSWADAKLAKLTGKPGPWMVSPKRMVQMRARGFCMRDAAPHVLQGLSIHEEARDIPPETKEKPNTDFLDAGNKLANPPLMVDSIEPANIMLTAEATNKDNYGKVNVVNIKKVTDTLVNSPVMLNEADEEGVLIAKEQQRESDNRAEIEGEGVTNDPADAELSCPVCNDYGVDPMDDSKPCPNCVGEEPAE